MKKILPQFAFFFLAFLFISNFSKAQAPFEYLKHIFNSDSIRGFDEIEANHIAMDRGFFGSEYHVYMYHAKRGYINKKYNINTGVSFGNYKPIGSNNVVNAAPCVNEGFESSPSTISTTTVGTIGNTLAGWQVAWGQNQGVNGSCTQAGCCPSPGSTDCWVRSTPWTAPAPLGVIPNSPFGGTKVLQMNDNFTNQGEVVRIQQTFPVTASNALFQFCYKAAMDGSGHQCCDQPYLRVELLDCNNNIVACPQVSITPPGPSCATVSATGWTTAGNISYTPNWIIKALDLSPYLGTCVTIKITVGDCDGWAHYGYAFFDCQCLPMAVTVNNIVFPAGPPISAVAACGVNTASMSAPPGLGPYTWNGPAGSGITNNPNQTITTTMAGQYTLTMNPVGICTPIIKVVTLTFGSFPTAGFTSANSCTTYSFTNTGTAAPSVQSYSFTGPGAPASYTTTSPTSVVNFGPSTTYTVWQTVTNPAGCPATFSMVITTPAGPSPAFTASPSFTQCFTGNAFTFNATNATGTHTYAFLPAAGAPPTGFTPSYGVVNFTAPGTYTVIHTINSNGCVSSTQSLVVVNSVPGATATGIPAPCAGGTATLSGSGGPGSISWAGPNGYVGVGPNANVSNFQPAGVGIYTMTVNNFGCITTKTVNLTLPVSPTLSVSNSGPICVGSPLTLSVSNTPANASYYYWTAYVPNPYLSYFSWMTATPTIPVTTAANAAIYTFYIGYPNCPGQSYTTSVQIVSPPNPTVSNTGPYCVGQTIQLNGTGPAASTYSWSGPSSFTSAVQNPSIALATTSMAGVYTLTNAVGSCKATKTVNVVVNPLPVPIIGSNSPVCLGNSINLTSGGGTSYLWSGPNAFTSAAQNPSIAGASVLMGGVYTVTVTNANGCKNTATVNVVITTPTTTASNTGPYCAGGTIQLNTPAGTTYTWTGPNAFTSNIQNPTIASASVLMSGTYTTLVTTAGCIATATTAVVVNALPTLTATNTGPYCPGATIQLNVNSSNTYTWTGPNAFNSNNQNPTIVTASVINGGVYTVSLTNTNGCENFTTTTVIVNPTPSPIIGSNSPVCLGSNLNLTSSGGTSFAWSGPSAFSSAIQNPTVIGTTVANGGVYTVTVTALSCTNTATVNVTIVTPTTTASNTGPFCAGTTIQLNTPAAISYTWTGPNAFTSNAQNPTIPNATVGMSGIYNLIATVGTCTAAASTSVTVNALPIPTASNNGPICNGLTLNLSSGGAQTYTWTGPNTYNSQTQNPSIATASPVNSGIYTVTVTDANGCKNFTTTSVLVNPTPSPIIGSNSPVCLGSNLNLTSSGGTSFAWSGPSAFSSAIQNPTVIGTTVANGGVYTVTVTALSCTNTATVNVTIVTPTTTASNTGPFCAGTTIQLNTPAAISYTWTGPNAFTSNAQNPTIPNATVGMSGIYNLIATVGTCTAAASTSVTVNALPIPTASNNGPICNGLTLNLSSGGAQTYTWTGPNTYNSQTQNPSIATASPVNSGIYTVTVTDANGCKNFTTTSVLVNPTPPLTTNGSSVCAGQTMNVGANSIAGSTYVWSGPNGFVAIGQNTTVTNAQPIMSGVYNVTVTSSVGCSNTGIANVSITPLPVPALTNNSPICVGGALNMTATGGSSYLWSGPNAFNNVSANPNINNVSMAANGIYSVLVTANGCSAMATTNVIINALPIPVAANNAPICEKGTLNLTGSGGVTYNWTGPLGFTSSLQNPSISNVFTINAGVYNLTVIDANGCQAATSTSVFINALPNLLANGAVVCYGYPATLTATGGVTYSWSGPNGFTSNLQNPILPVVNNNTTGNYTVSIIGANTCTSSSAVNVGTYPLPVPTITSTAKTCINTPVSLQGSPGFLMYQWTGPNNFLSPNASTSFTPTSMTQSGTYTLSVTDNRGCVGQVTTFVQLDPLPNAGIVIDKNKSCIPFCSNFTLLNSPGAASLVTASWLFNGQTFPGQTLNYCVTTAGDYLIKANFTDANGCPNSSTYTLNAYPIPTAIFEYSPANPLEEIDEVYFTDGSKGPGINSWHWYFTNNTGFQSTSQNPTYTYLKAGTYPIALVVTNKWGCSDTTIRTITVGEGNSFYVPNAFTPNGDGINDTFFAKGYNISKFEMAIFDRWGEKLFSSNEFTGAWDGTFKGEDCKDDLYVWKISVTTSDSKVKVYTGHVTLNR